MCVCLSVCTHTHIYTHKRGSVLVCFILGEDSFPQQALSGCFWVHSVHSWRLLLSPAYLTSSPLLSSTLLSSVFPLFTYLHVRYNIGELYVPIQCSLIHPGAAFCKTCKTKGELVFYSSSSKITPKEIVQSNDCTESPKVLFLHQYLVLFSNKIATSKSFYVRVATSMPQKGEWKPLQGKQGW